MNIYPIRYPPVLFINPPMPPTKPANTGRPIAPIRIYVTIDKVDVVGLHNMPASKAPSKPRLYGTGPIGKIICDKTKCLFINLLSLERILAI